MDELEKLVVQTGGVLKRGWLKVEVVWEHRSHTPQLMESFLRGLPVGSWQLYTDANVSKVTLKVKKGVL